MHDLIHDLAREVAGVKCKVAKLGDCEFNNRIHHLSLDYRLSSLKKIPSGMLNLKLLRTFLFPCPLVDVSGVNYPMCSELITSFRCLRVLDLSYVGVKSLPSSIGKLIHLRFLNLSFLSIQKIPQTITELQNLQTLLLNNCFELKQLPTDIRKLTNLKTLSVLTCPSLTHMPSGIRELTSLYMLPRFMVGHKKLSEFKGKPSTIAELSDLKNLNNLNGPLEIEINSELKDPALQAKEANLSSKHGLTELNITLNNTAFEEDEAVLEGLKPHPNIRGLSVFFYRGQKLPSWATIDNLCISLPNLVIIRFGTWQRCQQVPAFSQIRCLKLHVLVDLENVEYLEGGTSSSEALFFPSLKELVLRNMKNLKGWWNNNSGSNTKAVSFDKLSRLHIDGCPNLTFLPACPNVEHLNMLNVNKTISVLKMATTASSTSSSASESGLKLKSLTVDDVEELISLPKQSQHQLQNINIRDPKLVSTDRLEQVFETSLSSMPILEFVSCYSLRSISKGLKHLTALKVLSLPKCPEIDLSSSEHPPEAEDENGIWEALKGLHNLLLVDIPKLVALPTGLQQLTNLRILLIIKNHQLEQVPEWISCLRTLKVLELVDCPKLKSLPQGFRSLTSLYHLIIVACPGLSERCQRPDWQDWPTIQHIPLVTVLERMMVPAPFDAV